MSTTVERSSLLLVVVARVGVDDESAQERDDRRGRAPRRVDPLVLIATQGRYDVKLEYLAHG